MARHAYSFTAAFVLKSVVSVAIALSLGQFYSPPAVLGVQSPHSSQAPLAPTPVESKPQETAQSLPAVSTTSGQQVRINDRVIAAPWIISAGQLLIEESAAIQGMGVEPLSSSDYNVQPVQWFSAPQWLTTSGDSTYSLSTVLTSHYRLLNVTTIAEANGWQWQVQDGTLSITTPAAHVVGVRQSSQSWGDRVVVDLDQSTPWQVLKSGDELVIAIDASIDSNASNSVTLQPGSKVTAVRFQESGQQTVLTIANPTDLHAQIRTLAAPNRIVIDFQPIPTVEFSIQWAPGLWWHQQIVNNGNTLIPVTSLEIDPADPVLAMRPIWAQPTTIEGIQPLRTIAQQAQAIAAINGGFFNRNNQLPLGAIRHNGEWISGPILNRGAIAWTADGEFQFGRLSLQETLETDAGTVIPLKNLNSGYVQAGVSRYTPHWGTSYSPLTDYETIVTIQADQVIQQQQFEQAGQNRVSIPSDGYILAVRAYNSILGSLAVGTQVHLNSATTPERFAAYPEILGAGPLLLQNRQVVLNAQLEQFSDAFIQQKASRSAIGLTDQNHILLVTVHNQSDGSGVSLTQMAEIMRNLGTIDALNLDGGSSTTLTLGSRLLNVDPESVARVNNGIGIFLNLDSEAVESP